LAKQKIQINGMTLERGVCGGIINSSLAVESISLDHDSYDMGDEFSYVLVLRAVYPTRVPIRASLAEIEPKDPKMSYEWRRLSFALDLHSPSQKTIVVGLLSLVGSKEVQGTEIELKSGEWIELRGKAKMEWSNPSAGMLMPKDEKWLIPLPLQHAAHFTAMVLGRRGEGYFFNAETRQETRICHPTEQTYGGKTVEFTIHPKAVH
jgi:hypothetical protein